MMRCRKVPWLEMSLGWTCERWGNKEIKCKGRVGTDYGGPRKPGRMFRLDIIHGSHFSLFKRKLCYLASQTKVNSPWKELRRLG